MMQRYDFLKVIADDVKDALVVAAGRVAREWHSVHPGEGNFRPRTLGLASSIGLGLALALPQRTVIVLDGDGAFLMNLCGLPTIAWQNPGNLIHILFDNECYEASGSIATATREVADPVVLAKGAGYEKACWVKDPQQFRQEFLAALESRNLSLIAAKVEPGAPSNLPRIPYDEVETKYRFIRHLERTRD